MDPVNYVVVKLQKPMGIIFEENDDKFGGIFVATLKEGGVAEKNGVIKAGDQLVAVNEKKVAGMSLDDALGAIIATETPETNLVFFRGSAQQMYGPLGASKAWLDEFISKCGSVSK
jgi:C-terminal processing protease CtpA/Prc